MGLIYILTDMNQWVNDEYLGFMFYQTDAPIEQNDCDVVSFIETSILNRNQGGYIMNKVKGDWDDLYHFML